MKAQRITGDPLVLPEDSTSLENAVAGRQPDYRCLKCGSEEVEPKHVLIPGDDRYAEGTCRGCSFAKETGALKKYPLRPLVRVDLYGALQTGVAAERERRKRQRQMQQAYDPAGWSKEHRGQPVTKEDAAAGRAALAEIWGEK